MKNYFLAILAAVSLSSLAGCVYPEHAYVARPANTVVVKQPTVVRTPSTVVVR